MKRQIYIFLASIINISLIAGCTGCNIPAASSTMTETEETTEILNYNEISSFITAKTAANTLRFGIRLPSYTDNGIYTFTENGGWVGGFWPGINFLCFEMTGEKSYADTAQASMQRLKTRLYQDPKSMTHDVGFLFSLSYVADYKLTGNEESRKVALDAAEILSKRYNEKAGFINAWNVWAKGDPFSEENRARMIIDTMYNLPLLFWASQETGDERYAKMAEAHVNTCAEYIVRNDFSTFHTYVFDPNTGLPKYGRTYQGYSDESCWARGQAWAIGGFAHAYRYTKNEKYLEIAKKCAKFFIDHLEEDKVPMWDFRLPSKDGEPRDTSAASIAAAGLLEISSHVSQDEKEYYERSAKEILISLYNNYSTKDIPDNEGLLLQACGNRPGNGAINSSQIYGDYFFVESAARLQGKTVLYW